MCPLATCFLCLRALVSRCLACLCAHMPTCLACLRAKVPCVLTYSRVSMPFYAFRAYVPTCSGAITINNKNKLSIICFLYIFVIDLSFLFLLNKNVIHSCIALIRRNPLTGAVIDFVKKKWFDFSLSEL